MEHFRDSEHQIIDRERYMIWDNVNGEFVQFRVNVRVEAINMPSMPLCHLKKAETCDWSYIGNESEAIEFLKREGDRYIAIKKETIQKVKL